MSEVALKCKYTAPTKCLLLIMLSQSSVHYFLVFVFCVSKSLASNCVQSLSAQYFLCFHAQMIVSCTTVSC